MLLINAFFLQFDADYEEFKQSVEALKEQLQLFVDSWFEKSLSVSQGRQPGIMSTPFLKPDAFFF